MFWRVPAPSSVLLILPSFTLHILAAAQSATAQSSTWDSKLTFQQSLPDSEIQMERWRTSFKQSQDDKISTKSGGFNQP